MIDIPTIQFLAEINDSRYLQFKANWLYHTNKNSGSTFDFPELKRLLVNNTVSGVHDYQDVIESRVSSQLFDYIISKLGQPLTREMIVMMNQKLIGESTGDSKPDMCCGDCPQSFEMLITQPVTTFAEIVRFHRNFIKLSPFIQGNTRIARMLVIKQCIENDQVIPLFDSKYERSYQAALIAEDNDLSLLGMLFGYFQTAMEQDASYQALNSFINPTRNVEECSLIRAK